jgi:hypothetical protein
MKGNCVRVWKDGGSGGFIGSVRSICMDTGSGLDINFVAAPNEGCDSVRCQGNSILVCLDFF